MSDQIKTSPGAIWSLVLGILGIVVGCLSPLLAIPAIICGHISFSKINRSGGTLGGRGLAIAGFVCGYVGLALVPLYAAIAIPSFVRARTTAQANFCNNQLRQIESAKDSYALEAGLTNGAAITFEDIVPESTAAGGYLKQWPYCPTSTLTLEGQARTEADYSINPIGQNATCIHFGTATPPHRYQ